MRPIRNQARVFFCFSAPSRCYCWRVKASRGNHQQSGVDSSQSVPSVSCWDWEVGKTELENNRNLIAEKSAPLLFSFLLCQYPYLSFSHTGEASCGLCHIIRRLQLVFTMRGRPLLCSFSTFITSERRKRLTCILSREMNWSIRRDSYQRQ